VRAVDPWRPFHHIPLQGLGSQQHSQNGFVGQYNRACCLPLHLTRLLAAKRNACSHLARFAELASRAKSLYFGSGYVEVPEVDKRDESV
jgi:hypothetical protein